MENPTERKTRPNLKKSCCKFHNGTVNVECYAGVKYADVADAGGMHPCIDWTAWTKEEAKKRGRPVVLDRQKAYDGPGCPMREIPTDEEVAASKAESDARFKALSDSLAKGIVPPGVFVCGRRRR